MSENLNNSNRNGGSGNLYWIYGIVFLFILISVIILPERRSGSEITYNEFVEKLVARKVVKKVSIVNEKYIEVYLTDEALQTEEFKKKAKPGFFGSSYPAYSFKIVSGNDFEKFLKENKIPYEVIERTDYFGAIMQILLPILILVGIWVFFIRRIGNGVGGSQLFNIGKSKASLFDKENRVKVTFTDVAGLEEAKE
ncbi:MAG: AAA family ATPase, partial [Bacteroidia bacterium]|nr:AAA family ATPase [Bacteroidia bacterium]